MISKKGIQRGGVILFTLATLLSAWLVFWMEPLYSKMLLPYFGGAPNVWIVALMFFQAVLLVGYISAHFLTRLANIRHQIVVYLTSAICALAVLPPDIGHIDATAMSTSPMLTVVLLLSTGIALPMIVLSATAPLLQHWFSLSGHVRARDPYFLYAASNLGSFGALLAFPFLLEPGMALVSQSILWSVLFGTAIALILGCAFSIRGRFAGTADAMSRGVEAISSARPDKQQWLWWIALSAVPTSLLAGVTTIITTDIAAMPLLWVLPLLVYLGTFVLAFAGYQFVGTFFQRLTICVTTFLVALVLINARKIVLGLDFSSELTLIAFFLAVQFVFSFACNKALYRRRPVTMHLTRFYVAIAVGGLIGGVFNAVVAPQIFTDPVEFSLAIVLALALTRDASEPLWPKDRTLRILFIGGLAVGALSIALLYLVPAFGFSMPDLLRTVIASRKVWLVACIGLIILVRFPVLQAGGLALLLMGTNMFVENQGQIYAERSFFGVVRIVDNYGAGVRKLLHGTTKHGVQNLYPPIWREKLSYYGPNSPISDVFERYGGRLKNAEIGSVGLGTGTLACFRTPGQRWTYFEIDPTIVRISTEEEFFTFLSRCDPGASLQNGSILLGDARHQISQSSTQFDLLILDAFTSDAVPLHLLTQEAFQVYLDHLAPGGMLVIHISNRHLDLRPAITRSAEEMGLAVWSGKSKARSAKESKSHWLVIARDSVWLQDLGNAESERVTWKVYKASPEAPIWTDDYSNILTSLKKPGHMRIKNHIWYWYQRVRDLISG